MSSQEALIRRVPKGGTCSIKGLARQLAYLSRQSDPDRETVVLAGSQRHEFAPGAADAVDPNDVWAFARRIYERSGRLPPDQPAAELPSDLTIHFVISFPSGTDFGAAERTGRDWAEYVFGLGYRNDQGFVERHDYVTAFHCHDGEHPHMHVVVDRSPLGGGNLLTLHEGHPHWSYETMRHCAVDAAANHGIELIATDWSDRNLAERPLTEADAQELDRRLRERPITSDEHRRRLIAATKISHADPDFDAQGRAPVDEADPGDRLAEDLRRGCTPVVVARPEALGTPSVGPDHDGDNEPPIDRGSGLSEGSQEPSRDESQVSDSRESGGTHQSDNDLEQLRRARAGKRRLEDSQSEFRKKRRTDQNNAGASGSGSSSGRSIASGESRPSTAAHPPRLQRLNVVREQSEEHRPPTEPRVAEGSVARTITETLVPPAPNSGGAGGTGDSGALDNSAGASNRLGKRIRAETVDETSSKRQRTAYSSAEPTSSSSGSAPEPAQEPGAGDTEPPGGAAREASARISPDPLEQRRRAADQARESAMDALHAHRRDEVPSNAGGLAVYREEDRRLMSNARSALAEQRRAYAGMTNVETRAQARLRAARETEQNLDNGSGEEREPRSGNSRSR